MRAFFLLFFALPIVVMSNTIDEGNQMHLDPIHITGQIHLNPAFSAVKTEASCSGHSSDGGSLLRNINGVSCSRFGGRGIEPFIRGQSQTQLNVLLDGGYVHGGCPNRMDPPTSWAALGTYESVVVEKGVESLTHGSGGSGGTILFQRDTEQVLKVQGSHTRVRTGFSNGPIESDLSFDSAHQRNWGYLRAFGQSKKARNYKDGNGQEVRSSFDHFQMGAVLGILPSQEVKWEITFENHRFIDALYPGAGMDSPQESSQLFRLKHERLPDLFWVRTLKVDAYHSDVEHIMDNYSLRSPPTDPASHPMSGQDMLRRTSTNSVVSGAKISLNAWMGPFDLEYGVSLMHIKRSAQLDKIDAPLGTLTYMWPDTANEQLGIFIEGERSFSGKGLFKAGIRLDAFRSKATRASSPGLLTDPNSAYREYYGVNANHVDDYELSALFRYEHFFNDDFGAHLSLSQTARPADETERYINKWHSSANQQRWVGNPTLSPEVHRQGELGLIFRPDSFELRGSVFIDFIENFILRDSARGQLGVLQNDNADIYRNVDARLHGWEVEAEQKFTEEWSILTMLSQTRATNTTDADRPIAQTPPLEGLVELGYERESFEFSLTCRFASNQKRIDLYSKQEVGPSSGYGVVDFKAMIQAGRNWTLHLGVDNLLDHNYAEHINRSNLMDPTATRVNEPGRSAWVDLATIF